MIFCWVVASITASLADFLNLINQSITLWGYCCGCQEIGTGLERLGKGDEDFFIAPSGLGSK